MRSVIVSGEVGEELHKKGTTENIKRLATLCELCPCGGVARELLQTETRHTHSAPCATPRAWGRLARAGVMLWLEAAALQLARAAPTYNRRGLPFVQPHF